MVVTDHPGKLVPVIVIVTVVILNGKEEEYLARTSR